MLSAESHNMKESQIYYLSLGRTNMSAPIKTLLASLNVTAVEAISINQISVEKDI